MRKGDERGLPNVQMKKLLFRLDIKAGMPPMTLSLSAVVLKGSCVCVCVEGGADELVLKE